LPLFDPENGNKSMSKRRVVVTGLGLVSPIGNDLESAWSNITAGRSGIGPVTNFDASAFSTRIAGEVRDFDPTAWIPPKDAKKMDHFIHYGVAASSLMALEDSGLQVTEANAERVGALIGSGIGGIWGIEETTMKLHEGGRARSARSTSPARSSTCYRPGVAHDRHQGPEFLGGIGLRHLQPFDRHGHAPDPVRRRRRDGDGWRRVRGGRRPRWAASAR
jgi:hypothetical protein